MVIEMAPKTNPEGTVQIALPYDQPNYLRLEGAGDLEEPNAVYYQGPSGHETADDDEDDSVVRITTRARTTYELDRFNKHTMLIITNDRNDKTTIYLKHSFQRYNFEVTIIESEEDNQTERNQAGKLIDEFFQQDFSKIGATAVVMSTSTRCFPVVTQGDEQVQERDLLKYFIDHPALQGKPKIFITEARDSAFHDAILLAERVNADVGSTSFTGLPDDVLLIQAKMVYNDEYNKHAMLIITNDRNDKTTVYLKHSFQRYNFEVTIIESEEDNQTERNHDGKLIDEFFQQDFSKIGATAVVMSTSTRCFSVVTQGDEQVQERDLLKYFIDHPALQGKPKIFITEARDSAFHDAILLAERVNADVGSTSFTGLPDDVLLIQAKMVYNDDRCRPLDLLSHTLNSMNDRSSLHDMLPELYRKATERFPRHRAPIKYQNTLTKELVMDRIANELC